MLLYHFPTSPFARRVRIVLSLKHVAVELRDARNVPAYNQELKALNPLHTVPTLVDGERVVVDSSAICQYLEAKVPEPALWSRAADAVEAYELVALADGVITQLIDLGMRYAALHDHARFGAVKDNLLGRAQRALDTLERRVDSRSGPLCGGPFGMADIALYTMVAWLEGMPARATLFPPAKTMLELGWRLPSGLSRWADQHRQREEVLALDS